jgi:hypothetical protein
MHCAVFINTIADAGSALRWEARFHKKWFMIKRNV